MCYKSLASKTQNVSAGLVCLDSRCVYWNIMYIRLKKENMTNIKQIISSTIQMIVNVINRKINCKTQDMVFLAQPWKLWNFFVSVYAKYWFIHIYKLQNVFNLNLTVNIAI